MYVWFRIVSVGFKRLSVCVFGSEWYLWALIKRLSVCVCVCLVKNGIGEL